MKRFIYICLTALLFTAVSCNTSKQLQEEFMTQNDAECLVVDGNVVFAFDKLTCQESYSPDNLIFRVGDDTMTEYYVFAADRILGEKGSTLKGDIEWTTDTEVRSKKGLQWEVVKTNGELWWLWSQKSNIGVVVREIK